MANFDPSALLGLLSSSASQGTALRLQNSRQVSDALRGLSAIIAAKRAQQRGIEADAKRQQALIDAAKERQRLGFEFTTTRDATNLENQKGLANLEAKNRIALSKSEQEGILNRLALSGASKETIARIKAETDKKIADAKLAAKEKQQSKENAFKERQVTAMETDVRSKNTRADKAEARRKASAEAATRLASENLQQKKSEFSALMSARDRALAQKDRSGLLANKNGLRSFIRSISEDIASLTSKDTSLMPPEQQQAIQDELGILRRMRSEAVAGLNQVQSVSSVNLGPLSVSRGEGRGVISIPNLATPIRSMVDPAVATKVLNALRDTVLSGVPVDQAIAELQSRRRDLFGTLTDEQIGQLLDPRVLHAALGLKNAGK